METVLALVASVTALLAILLGPLISLKIARDQNRVDTLSTNRQAWINSLRDTISEYISAAAIASARSASTSTTQSDHEESIQRLTFLESKIELHLNPNESDHAELATLIAACSTACWRGNVDKVENLPVLARSYRDKIVSKTQAILKREWERVKAIK